MNTLIEYLRERLSLVARVCCGVLVLVALFSLSVDTSHAHTWVEQNIPFFWSVFGFCAAAAIIGIARWYGHSGIMVQEDYYERQSSCCCCGNKEESSSEQK